MKYCQSIMIILLITTVIRDWNRRTDTWKHSFHTETLKNNHKLLKKNLHREPTNGWTLQTSVVTEALNPFHALNMITCEPDFPSVLQHHSFRIWTSLLYSFSPLTFLNMTNISNPAYCAKRMCIYHSTSLSWTFTLNIRLLF